MEFADDLEVEVQTESERTKELPCRGCGRRLVVSTFYAPASKATCSACRGEEKESKRRAPTGSAMDPPNAPDLSKLLLNRSFAKAVCPAHPDDPDHEMELKTVARSPHHGPSEFMGYSNGVPTFRQLAEGETVLHQCLKCRATVSYSTSVRCQLQRVNEVVEKRKSAAINEELLGARPEPTNQKRSQA